jgi:hypothetical protein
MVTFSTFLCAESVVVDAQSHAASLFNLLERLTAPRFPVALQKLAVFARVERGVDDPASVPCEIHVYLGDEQLAGRQVTLDFGEHLRTRLILNISSLKIPRPGALRVVALVFGAPVASYEITTGTG